MKDSGRPRLSAARSAAARRSTRCAALTLLLAAIAAGCRQLPAIEPGVCGNAVVETGETCDGFARGDASCRPPGALQQCQLDCGARGDASRPACPTAWGCSSDDVCRPASGRYVEVSDRIAGDARSLLAGDFDGDGRGDIVELGFSPALGSTQFRLHYFDRDGSLTKTWAPPMQLISLNVAQVSPDSRADLVFSVGPVGILLGQSDRTMMSETHASYFLPATKVRMVGPLYQGVIADFSPLLVLADDGEFTLFHPDAATFSLLPFAQLPGSIDELAAEPVLGDVFDDDISHPCLDMALAMRGDTRVLLYAACDRDPESQALRWRGTAEVTSVALRPAAGIDAGPLLADVDGDGHLDVLVGAEGQLYVAFGDGRKLTSARPLLVQLEDQSDVSLPMPLAAGDFTGDGAADLVYPDGLLFSVKAATRDTIGFKDRRGGASWSTALIADLNANGLPDLIAASDQRLDIDFFNGTGSDLLNPFVISSQRPVRHLAMGDLDGDLIADLVFSQSGSPAEPVELSVAFGNVAGPPSAAVTTARVPDIVQIGTLPYSASASFRQVFIGYQQLDEDGAEGSAIAWLFSSGDRNFVCLVELTSFAADGSLDGVPGLSVTTGAFTRPDRLDALLLGSKFEQGPNSMWILPDLRSGNGRPQNMGWSFDPRLTPIAIDVNARQPELEFSVDAGDLDGNGLDELVIAAPDPSAEQCLIQSAGVQGDGAFQLVARDAILLDAPCSSSTQLAVRDLDADGAPDIVLLSGGGSGARSLLVFWNDGAGDFTTDSMTSLAASDESPHGYAIFQPHPSAPTQLAYVTDTRVRLLQGTEQPRSFAYAEVPIDVELERGTSITATDVDGDGIIDLVIADAGSIRVLRAELLP